MSALRLTDKYGRVVDRFRLSVTQRCNQACVFCHREGILKFEEESLTPEDYGFLAKVASRFSIKKHKLTGGEPLLRDDVVDIVRELRRFSDEVTLSTNGSLLKHKVRALLDAGLSRVNISLHSLREDVFAYIAKAPLKPVLEGFEEALDAGLKVKVNFVVMNVNAGEVNSLLDFAVSRGVSVNLIELVPLGVPAPLYAREHVDISEIEKVVEGRACRKYVGSFQNRPTYVLDNGTEVTLIRGYDNPHLCAGCTRLRLTPSGKFKVCIFREDTYIDASRAIKNRDEHSLSEVLRKVTLLREPYFHYRVG
ncbi:MAG: GTP 3',8-cyclase MoaA [Zestosphaera sp.]